MSSWPMYLPEGLNLGEAVLLTELISTAYDMQNRWKQ